MDDVTAGHLTDVKAATLVLGLGTLVSHGFGLSLVPAFLPRIEVTFLSGYGPLGGAVAAGLLAYAAGGLVASRVLDWLPNRTVLNATFLLTALALVAAASSPTVVLIVAPIVVLGFAAPISWAATTHVAARSVDSSARSIVMGGAAGGVGLGVIVNGVLVLLFSGPDAWRAGFAVAALISIAVAIASIATFTRPIDRPSVGVRGLEWRGAYRRVLAEWPGRVVVTTSAIAGVGAFTFSAFVTTTSIEDMGSTSAAAGALLWAMGAVGVVASLSLGRLGDRGSPTLLVSWMFVVCGAGLGFAVLFWDYPGLLVASLGVAILNYPVWGLVAAIATRRFDAPAALRAVSLGLVAAALLSAAANVIVGQWIDRVGSLRAPFGVIAVLTGATGLWLLRFRRAHIQD